MPVPPRYASCASAPRGSNFVILVKANRQWIKPRLWITMKMSMGRWILKKTVPFFLKNLHGPAAKGGEMTLAVSGTNIKPRP